MKRLTVVALLCVTALPIAAQTKALVVKNRLRSTVEFEGGRNFALPTACDEQGRLYVKLIKSDGKSEGPLLRLSSEGVFEAEFDTSGEIFNIYGVRPNGGVVMLHLDGIKVADNFGPDGHRESSIRLESPPTPFFPSQIAVFPSGEILLAGVQYDPGYKASTAIYDPTGHLIKQFILDGDAEIERALEVGDARQASSPDGQSEAISRSVAITGDDGFVYLMRATSPASVHVISAAGKVVRKIVVNGPDAGVPDFGIRVAQNRLAVKFRRCDVPGSSASCHGAVYAVVDATTGQKLSDYEADNEAAGPIACYAPNPDRFFTFGITSDQHHLEIVEAGPK